MNDPFLSLLVISSIMFFKAPCAYTPIKARSQSSPKYSFGVKHATDKFNVTPGKTIH